MKTIRVSVVGASGYIGLELIRLLLDHPQVTITHLTSRQLAGTSVEEEFPFLNRARGLKFEDVDVKRVAAGSDFVFTSLPHETSMDIVPQVVETGVKVVDLSGDFRFTDPAEYEKWYVPHKAKDLLAKSVYGLPELNRERIKKAFLVGNPGCYPTSIIIALAPLLRQGLLETKGIIADSKSGTSGAGRTPKSNILFCEVDEAFRAYNLTQHRHTPEIEEKISEVAGEKINLVFSPHLVPMNRGILSTIYARPRKSVTQPELYQVLRSAYADEPFIRVLPEKSLPNTAHVRGTNTCDLAVRVDERTNTVILVSAIDNLVKGGAGEAVQNMNLMMDFPETTGLLFRPQFP